MQHSNMRQKNEQVTVFSKNSSTPSIKIFKVVPPDFTLIDITPSGLVAENFFEDYYKVVLTTPNEDCYLYMQYGGNGIIMRVGAPSYTFFMIASSFQTGLTIPFRQISFDGDIIQVHQLDEIGEGLYYHNIQSYINNSFIEVEGFAYSVRDYPQAHDSTMNFTISTLSQTIGLITQPTPINITITKC